MSVFRRCSLDLIGFVGWRGLADWTRGVWMMVGWWMVGRFFGYLFLGGGEGGGLGGSRGDVEIRGGSGKWPVGKMRSDPGREVF